MVAVTGLGSGLDIDGLVAGLVGAERVPKEIRLNEREASATALISAFSSTKASPKAICKLTVAGVIM